MRKNDNVFRFFVLKGVNRYFSLCLDRTKDIFIGKLNLLIINYIFSVYEKYQGRRRRSRSDK